MQKRSSIKDIKKALLNCLNNYEEYRIMILSKKMYSRRIVEEQNSFI